MSPGKQQILRRRESGRLAFDQSLMDDFFHGERPDPRDRRAIRVVYGAKRLTEPTPDDSIVAMSFFESEHAPAAEPILPDLPTALHALSISSTIPVPRSPTPSTRPNQPSLWDEPDVSVPTAANVPPNGMRDVRSQTIEPTPTKTTDAPAETSEASRTPMTDSTPVRMTEPSPTPMTETSAADTEPFSWTRFALGLAAGGLAAGMVLTLLNRL